MTIELKVCDVCGSADCGSQNVERELYCEDEGMVRAGHLLEQTMIEYIWRSRVEWIGEDEIHEIIFVAFKTARDALRDEGAAESHATHS